MAQKAQEAPAVTREEFESLVNKLGGLSERIDDVAKAFADDLGGVKDDVKRISKEQEAVRLDVADEIAAIKGGEGGGTDVERLTRLENMMGIRPGKGVNEDGADGTEAGA